MPTESQLVCAHCTDGSAAGLSGPEPHPGALIPAAAVELHSWVLGSHGLALSRRGVRVRVRVGLHVHSLRGFIHADLEPRLLVAPGPILSQERQAFRFRGRG